MVHAMRRRDGGSGVIHCGLVSRYLAAGLRHDRPGLAQIVGQDLRPSADALQQVGLSRLQLAEAAQDIDQVEEVAGMLGGPTFGLDLVEL